MTRYPDVVVELSEEDGNSFSLIARTASALRRAGVSDEERAEFSEQAIAGPHEDVVKTIEKWVTVR